MTLPAFRPVVLDAADPTSRDALAELRAAGKIWQAVDTLDAQLLDLARTRRPGLASGEVDAAIAVILDGTPRDRFGTWVFYPWSGQLVRLLPAAAFRELRLDRNREKITREEQARLATRTVAVVGLSVGNAVALTLALEGACGRLRLADFDTLELSNMNRVRAAVCDIGLPKTVLAARQIAEIDPWLEVELLPEGATAANLDALLDGVDVLVDECDGLAMKFTLRDRARARRIPVIMETSDRGMLDVERFDLEPERPLFHGRVQVPSPAAFETMAPADKVALVMSIVGEEISPRLASSMRQVGQTISTWPQLGSAIVLGGATVCTAVRRLTLGEPLPSGRHYVDLDRMIATAP